jgi:hypothetical protein
VWDHLDRERGAPLSEAGRLIPVSGSKMAATRISIVIDKTLDRLIREGIDSDSAVMALRQTDGTIACVTAPGMKSDLGDAMIETFGGPDHATLLETADSAMVGLLRSTVRRGDWVDVDIDERAPRLRTARLPRALVESDGLVGVADLRALPAERPAIALGLWARLAGTAQLIGAMLSGAREGLTAEFGLAVAPDVLIVVGLLPDTRALVGVVTTDPIAADLVGLALWQSRASSRFEHRGPWEDPLVQRATELGLGVGLPEEILIDPISIAPAFESTRREISASLAAILARIGVPPTTILEPQ